MVWLIYGVHVLLFFFFKQKTAYEMRISDWSSDVCSSDLTALGYLAVLDDPEMAGLCRDQYRAADNMTDSVAALAILSDIAGPAREEALADFYGRWKDDPLVIDKWLAIPATSALPDTLWRIEELLRHPAFSLRNPNKVRSEETRIGKECGRTGRYRWT